MWHREGRVAGIKKKTKTLWSSCDLLQASQVLLVGTVVPSSARDSEQQKSAEFAVCSRHLRKSKVLTLWLADRGDKVFTRLCNWGIGKELSTFAVSPLWFFKAHFGNRGSPWTRSATRAGCKAVFRSLQAPMTRIWTGEAPEDAPSLPAVVKLPSASSLALDFDGGVKLINLWPEIIPKLWPFSLHGWGQKAIVDREDFRVEIDAFDL